MADLRTDQMLDDDYEEVRIPIGTRIRAYFRDFPKARLALVILGGLLLGGVAAVVTNFLFPVAVATVALVLGLSGPLGVIVPLVAVGLIGGLFGAELLAFLEEKLSGTDKRNHAFMRNLVITCALVAGVTLGIFIAASTPAVLNLLTVKALTGAGGAILPYVFAGLITLAVTGLIGYGLYRASGMYAKQEVMLGEEVARKLSDYREKHGDDAVPLTPSEIALGRQAEREARKSGGTFHLVNPNLEVSNSSAWTFSSLFRGPRTGSEVPTGKPEATEVLPPPLGKSSSKEGSDT